jgi:hypothetical protein
MPRVRHAAFVAALSAVGLSSAACGVGRETTGMLSASARRGHPSLAAGLITPEDLPEGFRPAVDHEVFRAFRPADDDCRRLFARADGADGVRQAHTVLYQIDPGGSLEERLVLFPRGEAARQLRLLRALAQGCRRFTFPAMAGPLDLRKAKAPVPRIGDDSYAVRYSSRLAHDLNVHFDWFAARVSRALLVLARPHLDVATRAAAPTTTQRIAQAAVARLRRLITHQRFDP